MDRKQKMTLSAVGLGVILLGAAAIQIGNNVPGVAFAQSPSPTIPAGNSSGLSAPMAPGMNIPGAGSAIPSPTAGGGMAVGGASAAAAAPAASPCSSYAPCTQLEKANRPKTARKDPFKLLPWEVDTHSNNAWSSLSQQNKYRLRIQPDESAIVQAKKQSEASASSQVEIPALKGRMVGVMLEQPVVAIIEIDRGTMIVQAGDIVEGKYRVIRIEADRVVLVPTTGKRYEMNLTLESASNRTTGNMSMPSGGMTSPSMPMSPGGMSMPGVPMMPMSPGR